ncbi:protein kinase [Thiohalorhabdus denitrificans]|uniref:Serine/threonine protein phosphatase PrpC n=1 Tax=Thiohalorhabdus denitrificans TaxID=381306 RepID=A0A0P9CAB1_9GAMM|nr:bifunctional protein-serine/threonine kinase/phosphatase [Thiohalorhabdus denitrificans]KPV39954.1 protein kinase [Thiohalorhabdus denitrificans]SCY09678.1 Serine/threonine protein phosphatase PrpC [Thiohalorhabdus denitrificans]
MPDRLEITVGQSSDKGRKSVNQDFYAAYLPREPQLRAKGAAIALADGISSSDVAQIASQTAVRSFLEDYYCTSEAWSVKRSAQQVILATNSWLHSLSRRGAHPHDRERGYACTLSAMVLKATTAHIFHVGDARIYRLRGDSLEQLTEDHRIWLSQNEGYLGRALGVDRHVEIDYWSLPLERDDIFLFATDGVYEHLAPEVLTETVRRHGSDLDAAAKTLVNEAYQQGSTDNLTAQLIRVEALPEDDIEEHQRRRAELPFPPALEPGAHLDGFEILRELHASHRSHVYLARDLQSNTRVALKTPTAELKNDPVLLDQFLTEEWIARRISSPHVIKARLPERRRSYTYLIMEFVEGRTLTQWMRDNPDPPLEKVRDIVGQIARGLRAFHRHEMVHQDIRPDNILIDEAGTARIIDLGSTRLAGLTDGRALFAGDRLLGTEQYSAPEYFLGAAGSVRSDVFSLGVVTYQMLTGTLPYGTQVPKARTRAAQHKLKYEPALNRNRSLPAWVDATLRRAVHPNPERRYADADELAYDLRHPRREFLDAHRPPLIERNPESFWQGVSAVLAVLLALAIALD